MQKRLLGQRGERQAERFLRARGLRTVSRNWRCRHGELDLVATDGESLIFVEVRLRSPRGFGGGADSVHAGKQQRLIRAASMYLAEHPDWQQRPCRFDVVAIDGESDRLDWIVDAFQADGV